MTVGLTTAIPEVVDRALGRAAGSRLIPGNRVRLLRDGPEAYPAMLRLIASAAKWVHFENYIIRDDATGWLFAEALAAQARAGVRVRVLYDWLGSFATQARYWAFLRGEGVEVRAFHPPRLLDLFANVSRNHRKLVVADGANAVTGGLCIGDEWSGDRERDVLPWRDTAIEVVGPAAAALDQAFLATWRMAGGSAGEAERVGEVPPAGEAALRVVAGEPGRERVYRILELLATGSQERLWITDAYLVAPRRLFHTLLDAARDGVDVRLLVPGSSDLPLVRNLTRVGYRDLLRKGVRIFEWAGPMLHAKTLVADGRWVRIGSSNLNASSLVGNYELDVLVDDQGFAAELEAQFRRDLAQSAEVGRRPLRAPERLRRVLPMALERAPPERPARHELRPRERRGRTALALRTLVAGARRSLFVPLTILLIVLAVLFLVLPTTMAYVFGALCAWFAVAAGLEAFRRRVGEWPEATERLFRRPPTHG